MTYNAEKFYNAVVSNSYKSIKYFLTKFPDFDPSFNGNTCARTCADYNYLKLLKLLLENEKVKNSVDIMSLFEIACEGNNYEVARYLKDTYELQLTTFPIYTFINIVLKRYNNIIELLFEDLKFVYKIMQIEHLRNDADVLKAFKNKFKIKNDKLAKAVANFM